MGIVEAEPQKTSIRMPRFSSGRRINQLADGYQIRAGMGAADVVEVMWSRRSRPLQPGITEIYDRRRRQVTRNIVERISI
jgi:hypothetical protein